MGSLYSNGMAINDGALRIALVSRALEPTTHGGIARFMTQLAPALRERGHDVRMISQAVPSTNGPSTNGPSTRSLVPEAFGHINHFTSAVVDDLDALVAAGWTPHAVYGPAWDIEVLGVLRATQFPICAMLATPLAVAIDHSGHNTLDADRPGFARMLTLEAEVFTRAHRVHAISDSIVSTINHNYPVVLSPPRTVVRPLGLRDTSTPPRRSSKKINVLFVGRLERRKGIDTLLEAIPELLAQHPQLHVTIAGQEMPHVGRNIGFADEFRATYRKQRWLKRVHFVGEVSNKQLTKLYATSHIACFPSRYESFGLVAIEAMQNSLPVIATFGSGLEDIVQHQHDGLLVPPNDVAALSRAINTLVQDPALRQTYGTNARRHYDSTFTIAHAAQHVESILREIAR